MNKNIDLGTFQWDTNKIENQIAANNLEMGKFAATIAAAKKEVKDQGKEIALLEGKIEAERKTQERLRKELENGYRSQESYNAEIEKSNQNIDQFISEQNKATKAQAEAIIAQNRLQNSTKELRLENNELNKLLSNGRVELSQNESAYRELNGELNALKIEAKNLGAQMVILERDGKKGTDEYKRLAAQFTEASQRADELNDQFKAIDKSVGDNQRTVGDYRDQIISAFDEIKLGAMQLASGNTAQGINTIKSSVSGLTTTAKTFYATVLTNPFTWVLAAVAGLGLLIKTMWDYNNEVREINKEVSMLTNTTGSLTDELRRNGQAISETYGKDFKEAVVEQNELMKDFGLSAQEAFDIYNQGLAQGGAENSEFGDSIREYGSLFAQNGYSAKEFIAILNSGIDLGVYNDKLPDAIKEAGLALNEQTKATRDALVNAFGASFSDDLLKRVQSGKTTVADGLEEISKQAEKANLNQQQLAQLTVDLFKGAGEDAGGALVVFEAINHAQEIMSGNLTDLEQKTIELGELNKKLEEAKDAAFKSDGVQSMQYQIDQLWKKTQIFFLDLLSWFQKADRATIQASSYLRGWFKGVPEAASATFQAILKSFSELLKGIQSGGSAISKFLSGDLDGAKADADKFMNALPNAYKNLQSTLSTSLSNMSKSAALEQQKTLKEYDNTIKAQSEIQKKINAGKTTGATGDAEAKAAEEARKKAEAEAKKAEATRKQAETKRIADAKKAADEAQKLLEQEAKRALEIAREQANQAADIAKNELTEYIATNAEKLNDDKRLNAEKVRLQKEYFDEYQKQQENINALEFGSKEFAIQQKIDEINAKKNLNKNDLAERKNLENEIAILKKDYYNKDLELQNSTNEKKKEIDVNYENQKLEDAKLARAIDFEQRLLDLETNSASEYEINKEILAQQREQDLEALEEQRAQNLISLENYEARKALIEGRYRQSSITLEREKENQKLSAISQTLGQASSLFAENTAAYKTLAIAQATMNTYLAATAALTTQPPWLGIAMAAVTIATGLANVAKIASTNTNKKAARGMMINGASHANGGVPISTPNGMIEAEGGEIIINKNSSRLFARELSAINQAGGGIPLYAGGGRIGVSASNLATVQKSIVTQQTQVILDENAISQISGAIYNGSQSGMKDLATDRTIAQGASF